MGKVAAALGRHRRLVRALAVAAGLLLIVGLLVVIKGAQIGSLIEMGKQMEQVGPPPEAVGSAVARLSAWESTLSAVGSISGVRNVSVSNEVPGVVTRIRFRSGEIARRGQVLVELDADVERAQLASARAQRNLASVTATRTRNLAAGEAIPQAQLDEAEADLASARSSFATAAAQLQRKVVRAPFDGRLGIRLVTEGQYLNPGAAITTLDALGGTFVDFSLPQEELAAVSVGLPVRVQLEGAATTEGTISAIEPTLDPSTRNVKIRATLPARVGKPRPGMFVTVEVIQPKRSAAVTVPMTAILHAPYGDSVFVIEPKPPGSPGLHRTPDGKPVKVARQQFVRLGAERGDFVAVTKGLREGQEVVSAGAFKLRNGMPVVVDNRTQPTPQLDPRPENR